MVSPISVPFYTDLTKGLRVFLFRMKKTASAREVRRKRKTRKPRRSCKVRRESNAQGSLRHLRDVDQVR